MGNTEDIANSMLPQAARIFIMCGIMLAFIGLLKTIYRLFEKEWPSKKIFMHFLTTVVLGLLISTAGLFLASLPGFETNTSGCGTIITIQYILSLCILILFVFRRKKQEK